MIDYSLPVFKRAKALLNTGKYTYRSADSIYEELRDTTVSKEQLIDFFNQEEGVQNIFSSKKNVSLYFLTKRKKRDEKTEGQNITEVMNSPEDLSADRGVAELEPVRRSAGFDSKKVKESRDAVNDLYVKLRIVFRDMPALPEKSHVESALNSLELFHQASARRV